MLAAISVEPAQDVKAPAPSSEYAEQMPRLRYYASLPADDPVRGRVREDLILAFMPVVEHLARRHGACQPATRADLVQVGTIGLINAIDRWDPERARGDFLGYLVPYVRGEILRYFRDRTWSLRVPRRLKDLSVAINRCTGPLSQKLTRAPQPAELAEHLGVDLDEVLDALEAQASYQMGTLDALNCDSNTSAAERIGEIDADLDLVEYRHALRPLLEKLPERERTILILRFFRQMTQTQIAQQIGISQMHVSRLLSATLAALRSALLDDSPPEPRAPGPARRPANNRRPAAVHPPAECPDSSRVHVRPLPPVRRDPRTPSPERGFEDRRHALCLRTVHSSEHWRGAAAPGDLVRDALGIRTAPTQHLRIGVRTDQPSQLGEQISGRRLASGGRRCSDCTAHAIPVPRCSVKHRTRRGAAAMQRGPPPGQTPGAAFGPRGTQVECRANAWRRMLTAGSKRPASIRAPWPPGTTGRYRIQAARPTGGPRSSKRLRRPAGPPIPLAPTDRPQPSSM